MMRNKSIFLLMTVLITALIVTGDTFVFFQRSVRARRTFAKVLLTAPLRESISMDADALATLNSNCITRDYLIRVLNRTIEIKKSMGGDLEPIYQARSILEQVPRCMARTQPLEKVPVARWVVLSNAVRITDEHTREALLKTKNFWEEGPPILAWQIEEAFKPIKSGRPTVEKLRRLEALQQEYPNQENIKQNLLRFYVALRDYDGFKRLLNDPIVQDMLNRDRKDPFYKPFHEFKTLARATPSKKNTYALAAFYFLHGDIDNAEALCVEGLSKYPDTAAFHFLRALALHGQGRDRHAFDSISYALALEPNNTVYQNAEHVIRNTFNKKKLKNDAILCYHQVNDFYTLEPGVISSNAFESHLRYLNAEGLADAHVCDSSGQLNSHNGPAVGLTFDDGYIDTGEVAWPLVRRYGRRAAMFVIANRIFDHPSALNIQQIRDLQAQGLRIGSHSLSHPNLKELDRHHMGLEIDIARWIIERNLGESIDCFAYPYGAYSIATEHRLRSSGFTQTYALDNVPAGIYPTRRTPIVNRDSLFLFKIKLYGLDYDFWLKAIKNQIPG